jgi:hypothetical protein
MCSCTYDPHYSIYVHTALGGAEKDGGIGILKRTATVKEYDLFGHEVGEGRRVGPLRRVPMTLGWDRGKDNWEATSRMTDGRHP